jgi:RimJ/RimL family protein N-acetyltransferase
MAMAQRTASPIIETPRLRLRPFAAADWEAYAAISADAEVMRHIGAGGPVSRDDAWRAIAAFLGHWALRGYGMWALEHRDSAVLLGRVGYLDPPGWPGFELGWLLGREHWGHGYAREAAAAALRHAFEVLQRDRVISLIRPGNQRSIAVARAIGETPDGAVQLLGGEALVYAARR